MKSKIQISFTILLLLSILFLGSEPLQAQNTMPEVMDEGTLQEQLDYVKEKTRIYNNFRAIREDIFLKMKKNSLDSLSAAKQEISGLETLLDERNSEISSLNSRLNSIGDELDEAVKNRDSLSFIGIQMEKGFYNTLMWLIVAALAAFLAFLFVLYRRNHVITVENKKELDETRESFENYKKEARERYEKLVVSHHNEIMKLKGG